MKILLNQNLSQLKPDRVQAFTEEAKEVPDCILLTKGEPDFGISDAVNLATTKALNQGNTHYAPNNGTYGVRRAVVDFENRLHDLHYEPEEVIMTNGATEAIFLALHGILNPGDEVVIPLPALDLYENITRLCGATPVFLDTADNDFQISAEALDKVLSPKTKVLILNSPRNPTGTVYHPDSLQAVHDAVQGKPIFVLCDDVYNQLLYGQTCPLFAHFTDLRAQILIAQSFSKTYAMAGFRMGYLMGDGEVIGALSRLHTAAVLSVASFSQDACIHAIHFDCLGMLSAYESRREYLCSRLHEMGLEYVVPEGAFYVFPSIAKYGLDSETFCRRLLRQAKVAALPGSYFGQEGFLRLSYSCPLSDLKAAMARLETFLSTLSAQN